MTYKRVKVKPTEFHTWQVLVSGNITCNMGRYDTAIEMDHDTAIEIGNV